jgi:hypothetical protein
MEQAPQDIRNSGDPREAAELLHDILTRGISPDKRAVPARADGIATGEFRGWGVDGAARVDIPALGQVDASARSMVAAGTLLPGQTVALCFEGGDPRRPVILGPLLDAAPTPEASIDGERVLLRADKEIELRCGDAAIVLTADGRITLRGKYVTSQASATHRILGGSVNVN